LTTSGFALLLLLEYFEKRKKYTPSLGVSSNFYPGDIQTGTTLDDFGKHLEAIRIRANHPGLGRGGYNLEKVADKDQKQPILTLGYESFLAKTKLYRRFVREGIFSSTQTMVQEMQATLIARAEAQKLPADYFLDTKTATDSRKWWQRLLKQEDKLARNDEHNMGVTINRIFSEEFMRLLADNQDELEKCKPDTIEVFSLESKAQI
jgi:hypothetical protein